MSFVALTALSNTRCGGSDYLGELFYSRCAIHQPAYVALVFWLRWLGQAIGGTCNVLGLGSSRGWDCTMHHTPFTLIKPCDLCCFTWGWVRNRPADPACHILSAVFKSRQVILRDETLPNHSCDVLFPKSITRDHCALRALDRLSIRAVGPNIVSV